jgi:serine/threonine protein kinase/class 3 adenylate cyclase
MTDADANVDRLLKAREDINEELRRLKSSLTILFTDVVGSTAYFDRYGDTAGVAMLHSHTDVVGDTVESFHGRVVKTIGDSVMAEFPDPKDAVQAAVSIQRRQLELNLSLSDRQKIQMRIGINTGVGFRKAGDVYGDVVNLAARLTKRSGPAQILISGDVQEGSGKIEGIIYHHLGKVTVEGRSDKDELYEVIWTDPGEYAELRRDASNALMKGEHAVAGQSVAFPATEPEETTEQPGVLFPTPLPAPAALSVRYDLLEEVGQGGMGIVYKARDRETGDLVALKLLKPEIAADQKIMGRFKNELRLARQITHKNICRIYEFNRVEGTACISMEYVEGESLRSILNRFGTLSVRKAVEVIRQVCRGLNEAHSQGVIHRDLKPENVMMDSNSNDFGIARSVYAPATKSGQAIGTPAYMAPEQAECKPVDSRTDVYAVGLVLFEVLTGTRAFQGETAAQVAFKQVNDSPPLLRQIDPTLPVEVEEVIARCLDKNPDNRFPSCEALNETLAALVAGGELPKELPPAKADATTTVTLRFSPNWRLGWGSLFAIGLLAVLLGWGGWQMIKQRPVAPPPVDNTTSSIPPPGVPPVQEKQVATQEEIALPPQPAKQGQRTEPPQTSSSKSGQSTQSSTPVLRQAAVQPSTPVLVPDDKPTGDETEEVSNDSEVTPPTDAVPDEPPPVTTPKVEAPPEETQPPEEQPAVTPPPINDSEDTDITPAIHQVFLQVRTYKSERDAVRLRNQLEEMNFPVQLLTPQDAAGNFRVRVGPFESLDVARSAQRRLDARGFKSTLQIGEL